ncbi:hypothetical protein P7C73_g3663, partial [Tremellales sp. Uapishka_1]
PQRTKQSPSISSSSTARPRVVRPLAPGDTDPEQEGQSLEHGSETQKRLGEWLESKNTHRLVLSLIALDATFVLLDLSYSILPESPRVPLARFHLVRPARGARAPEVARDSLVFLARDHALVPRRDPARLLRLRSQMVWAEQEEETGPARVSPCVRCGGDYRHGDSGDCPARKRTRTGRAADPAAHVEIDQIESGRATMMLGESDPERSSESDSAMAPPKDQEEWDKFVSRYAYGHYFNRSFSTDPNAARVQGKTSRTGPEPTDGGLDITIEESEPTTAKSTLTENHAPVTGNLAPVKEDPVAHAEPSTTSLPLPLSSPNIGAATDSDGPKHTDDHPRTSTSGAANQDPGIPNMASSSDEEKDGARTPSSLEEHQLNTDSMDLQAMKNALPEGGTPSKSLSSDRTIRHKHHTSISLPLAPLPDTGPSGPLTRDMMAQHDDKNRQDMTVREQRIRSKGSVGSKGSLRDRGSVGSKGSLRDRGSTGSKGSMREAREAAIMRRKQEKEKGVISSGSSPEEGPLSPRPPRPKLGRTGSKHSSRGSRRSRGDSGGGPHHTPNTIHTSTSAPTGRPLDAEDNADSATNSSGSVVAADLEIDLVAEKKRIREFYEKNGYMPAPRQPTDATRRRLRAIRRLGLDGVEPIHRETLDRFTRLAASMFKTTIAAVTVVSAKSQFFPSEVGLDLRHLELDAGLCCHTIMSPGSGDSCMVVPDTSQDWRFKNNPWVKDGKGPIQFYAGAPLRIGKGPKAAVIGTLCIIDDKPREFSAHGQAVLQDLAECVVSEGRNVGQSLQSSTATSSSGGRREKADSAMSDDEIDIYDEACQEIRLALDAHAVAVVDLSQFHLFYPAYQSSSTAGSSTRGGKSSVSGQSQTTQTRSNFDKTSVSRNSHASAPSSIGGEEYEPYAKQADRKVARSTYGISDPTAPSRTPQVLFIPGRRKTDPKRSRYTNEAIKADVDDLAVLGYSCAKDGFVFNFTSSPAARKIISDFIANNVKTRRVWYAKDDGEGIAQSITHLMPPGTETSMAMPVFGFDGQVAFAVVACWTDPLYTYPSGAMQFVETIAGSLLASVMKERLHRVERAQLSFAAAASHELRTPLHQLNAAAAMLRQSLGVGSHSPGGTPFEFGEAVNPRAGPPSPSDRHEVMSQLEIIESNGASLGSILENIIDTLDIGQSASRSKESGMYPSVNGKAEDNRRQTSNLGTVLENILTESILTEEKSRRVAGTKGLEDVEIILEVAPRNRGGWLMTDDSGPLSRALGKIIHNAIKFTDQGYIHISVQDVSREAVLPAGYDNSIKLSTVSIDIKDSGCGMSPEFLSTQILLPFAKADPFMPGSGLGLGLAQRMIEILGGRFAIASTLGQGTLVHVEVPLHLLSGDHDSDAEDLEMRSDDTDSRETRIPTRQDGVYVVGFNKSKVVGIRRVGKSLIRQLKYHHCRVVQEIQFASLILAPDGALSENEIANLVKNARPGVEVILLGRERQASLSSLMAVNPRTGNDQESKAAKVTMRGVTVTKLSRPLRPSVLARIMRPKPQGRIIRETYISPTVGDPTSSDDERRRERILGIEVERARERAGMVVTAATVASTGSDNEGVPPSSHSTSSVSLLSSRSTHSQSIDQELYPSPQEEEHNPFDVNKDDKESTSHLLRPPFREQQSNPLPLPGGSPATSEPGEPHERPKLKHVAETAPVPISVDAKSTLDSGPGALRVLVVEDNVVNRKILTTMLRRTASKFAEAVDGFDAVSKFLSFAPNLVLLDINMPRKDGFEAAAEMREIERIHKRSRAKIIAVTALSGEGQKRKGMLECGIDEWRTKPVAIKELKSDVEKMAMAIVETSPIPE